MQTESSERRNAEWVKQFVARSPRFAESFTAICAAVKRGTLSLAEVGGFTDHDLDSMYACACHYLDMREPRKTLAIAAILVMMDRRRAEYYRLIGIALHHLKEYGPADRFYARADLLRPNDPLTLMYRGEVQILSHQEKSGVLLLKQGMALAAQHPALRSHTLRAGRVLKIAEAQLKGGEIK
jgi:hypothetical protein